MERNGEAELMDEDALNQLAEEIRPLSTEVVKQIALLMDIAGTDKVQISAVAGTVCAVACSLLVSHQKSLEDAGAYILEALEEAYRNKINFESIRRTYGT